MSATSTSPVIGFIDIDAFECQVFQRDQPQYFKKPCVVVTSSGRVLSATYEAKALGISRTTTPYLKHARKLCPNVHAFRKPDVWGKQDSLKTRHATWEILDRITEFCRRYGNDLIIELASSDEFYLDISAVVTRRLMKKKTSKRFQKGIPIPKTIVWERQKESKKGPFKYIMQKEGNWKKKQQPYLDYVMEAEERLVFGALFMDSLCTFLEQKTQLSASAGVASNKLLAKVGCGLNKPAKITIATSSSVNRISKKIPISSIPGLGGVVGERIMETFNIKTMAELGRIPLVRYKEKFDTEFSNRLLSWGFGKDNQPVEAKVMKDKISCNKPAGLDIKGVKKLTTTLHNLMGEMKIRLKEEKDRHKRMCNSIRFDVTYSLFKKPEPQRNLKTEGIIIEPTSVSASTGFDTKEEDFTIQKLVDRILEFIKGQPEFNIKNFRITEFGITLKDFEFMDVVDHPGPMLHQKTLRIIVKNNATAVEPLYKCKAQIGAFRTTPDGKYASQDIRFPKLLSPQDELSKLKGKFLGQGFIKHTKKTNVIKDHTAYYECKHRCFIQWLRESKYFDSFSKPHFIAFNGRIADAMRTPLTSKHGGWELYAINIRNVIHLWDQKQPKNQVDEFGYCGIYFQSLVTYQGTNANKMKIQEFDKTYLVNEATLGNHELLIVNQVDAQVEENGEFIEVSVFNQEHWEMNRELTNHRKLKLWTQSLISGAKNILIGLRDNSRILRDVKHIATEDLKSQLTELTGGDSSLCVQFQNRLLDWIKLHLPASDEKLVKRFSWVPGHSHVVSDVVPQQEVAKLLVPRLYSSLFNDLKA